jgi:hypothetical protein
MQDFIPTENAHNAHLKRFVYMPFDEAFGQFWRQTEHIRLLSTDKAHRELYRDAFTKQALWELSRTMPWTFLRGGDGALHLCYDEAAGAEGVELLAFDAGEKAHVDAVARACFGPAVLSICMLGAEVRGGGLVVEQEPYYQVFRQHDRYVHSLHAETAHKLTEAEVQGGADIAALHAKLGVLVGAEGPGGGLTFVAHNAVRDRQWLAQSIQEQIRYLAYTDCKSGSTAAGGEIAGLHALLDRLAGSRWFCTQHGDLDVAGHARARNGALAKIMEHRGDSLRRVYEKVTGWQTRGWTRTRAR